jgi:peptide/nickel transport system substrate-binding protein/oligopeptide transport system substrate-binding protein
MRRLLHPRAMVARSAFALLIAVALIACAGTTHGVCGCSAPPDPQILSVLASGQAGSDVGSLDPAHVTGALEYEIAHAVFPPLIALDANLEPVDWAAKSRKASGDGLTWTFHLNSGMKWSDGNPIDSWAFAYSLNRTLDPCTRSEVAHYLFSISGAAVFHAGACPAGAHTSAKTLVGSSIIASDPLTLQIKLSAPDPSFLFALTTPGAWAVPEQLIKIYLDHWTEHLADGDGLGGNLFAVRDWDHNGHLNLVANDSFWGKKSIFQHVNFLLYRSNADVARYYAAGNGDVAIAPTGTPTDLRKLQGYSTIPALYLTYLVPNWRMAPFDDLRMRQALALAVDRRALLHDAARDADLPTFHMVPLGVPQYNGHLRDSADRTGDAALTSAPEKALALAQSYANSNCGGSIGACPPITLTYVDTPDQQALAQELVAQWLRVLPGLQFSLRAVNPATLDQTARSSQVTLTTWRADLPDTLGMLLSRLRTGGAQNLGAASLPDADTLLDQAATISSGPGYVSLDQVSRAEQLYVTTVAWIPLAQGTFAQVMRPEVRGLTYSADQHISLTTWQVSYIVKKN